MQKKNTNFPRNSSPTRFRRITLKFSSVKRSRSPFRRRPTSYSPSRKLINKQFIVSLIWLTPFSLVDNFFTFAFDLFPRILTTLPITRIKLYLQLFREYLENFKTKLACILRAPGIRKMMGFLLVQKRLLARQRGRLQILSN